MQVSWVVDRNSGILDSPAVNSKVFLMSTIVSISNGLCRRPTCKTLKNREQETGVMMLHFSSVQNNHDNNTFAVWLSVKSFTGGDSQSPSSCQGSTAGCPVVLKLEKLWGGRTGWRVVHFLSDFPQTFQGNSTLSLQDSSTLCQNLRVNPRKESFCVYCLELVSMSRNQSSDRIFRELQGAWEITYSNPPHSASD